MKHDYNYYNKEELLACPKIPLAVFPTEDDVFKTIAKEMVNEIKIKNSLGKRTVFICPVGPTGQYHYFVEMVNKENIDLKNVWIINMDEYLTEQGEWISEDDPLSFRGFMEREVYSKINPNIVLPKQQRIFPNPRNTDEIEALIEYLGGVDICFGGIGINGHIAFNEATDILPVETFKNLHTRVLEISRETKTANAIIELNGAIDDMPRLCITIGMYEILHSRKIRLGCFRNWHRSVVRHAAYGEISSHFPATLVQEHSDALIWIPESVANL
jgi:glucosamine-6-phosphate deaminase